MKIYYLIKKRGKVMHGEGKMKYNFQFYFWCWERGKDFFNVLSCGRLSGQCWQYMVGDTDLQKLKPQDVRGNSSSIYDSAYS